MRAMKEDPMQREDSIKREDSMKGEDSVKKEDLETRYTGKISAPGKASVRRRAVVLQMLAKAAKSQAAVKAARAVAMAVRPLKANVIAAGMTVLALGMTLTVAGPGAMDAYAGIWQQEGDGTWYYQTSNGRLTGWHWIDGNGDGTAQCYCFDPNGRMKAGTTVDGWQVNADGAWVQNGVVQTQQVAPGSHHAAGSGSAAGSTGSGSANTAYTPERARMEARSYNASTDGVPYQGKVWTYDDYCYSKSEARAKGKLYVNDRCNVPGCCNPHIENGLYCAVHTCKEPGCRSGLAISKYNAGYCYTHMKAHGIDEYEFTKIENARQQAAREAAAAAAAAQAKSESSGSSSKSSGNSSAKPSGSSKSSSYSSSSSSGSSSSSRSSSSSSSKKSSSYYDSYDDGYDDVYYNEWYDENRYRTDWDYMSGVDDAMADLDEDW